MQIKLYPEWLVSGIDINMLVKLIFTTVRRPDKIAFPLSENGDFFCKLADLQSEEKYFRIFFKSVVFGFSPISVLAFRFLF